jgi:hypothetical protein
VRATAVLVGLAALALLTTSCGGKRAGNTPRTTTTAVGGSTEQRADNQNALNNEAATISTDFFNLRGELATLAGDVPAGAQTLAGERTHVQTARRDLQLTSSATTGRLCPDADRTQGDVEEVHGDVDTQHGDEDTFVGDAQSVLFAVGQLKADNGQFRHDLAVVRNYVPAGAPSAAAVAAALASARAAVAKGQSTLASDLRVATQLLAQASSYATRAQAICTTRGQ